MAPTVVGVSADPQWTNDGTLTALLSGAEQAGDLLVLLAGSRLAAATIDLASGYTLRSTDNETTTNLTVEIQAKAASSSESGPAVSSSVTATQPTGAIVVAVRGWSGTVGDVAVTSSATSSATVTFPAAAVAVDGSLVLRLALSADNNNDPAEGGTPPAAPTGHTELLFSPTQIGSDATILAYSQDASATTAGAASASVTLAGADPYIAYTVVVPPAAGGTNAAADVATAAATAHDPQASVGAAPDAATGAAAATAPQASVSPAPAAGAATAAAQAPTVEIPASGVGARVISTTPPGRSSSTTPAGRHTSTTPGRWT